MRCFAVLLLAFVHISTAGADEQAKGFLGAELRDVTKEEANALGLGYPARRKGGQACAWMAW